MAGQVAQVLCKAKADVHAQATHVRVLGIAPPPLHLAAANGYLRVMQVLCDTGANIDMPDDAGHTALFQAVASPAVHGQQPIVDVVRFLCGAKADLDKATGHTYYVNVTPYRLAMRQHKFDVARVLRDAGADTSNMEDEVDEGEWGRA